MFQYTIAVDGPKKDVRKRNNKFGNPTKTETGQTLRKMTASEIRGRHLSLFF